MKRSARIPRLLVWALAIALVASACSSGAPKGGGAGQNGKQDPLASVDPASLAPAAIVGKGPNGEQPGSPADLKLTDDEAAKAKAAGFKVGIVMQTMDIDWSKLQVAGITDTLKQYGAQVVGVTDAKFKVDQQIADIENMIQKKPDAIISIPVDDTATAEAYKKVAQAGIKLVFIHQAPRGLKHPQDFASMVSPDNQGNGQIAAQMLAKYIPNGGTLGIIDFGIDFFTTNQRTERVKQWLKENRPDIKVKEAAFTDPSKAESVTASFLTANPDVQGLFSIWDAPAMAAVSAMRAQGKTIPITTIDLGNEDALEMANGGLIKGVGAQQPYDQGVAEALAAIKALLGKETPAWVALPAVPVTQKNVLQAYQEVFHKPPTADLTKACSTSKVCGSS